MKKFTLIIFLTFLITLSSNLFSQGIAINNTGVEADPSAALDLISTTKGLLIPRMTTTQRTSISSPAKGLLVFDNTENAFYYYSGTSWQALSQGGGSSKWTNGTNSIYANNNSNAIIYDVSQPFSIYGKVSSSSSGGSWGWSDVKAGIFGMSHSQSYHAGVYGWVEGTAVANEAAVLGAYSSAIFGGLGFTDGTTAWAGYFQGPVKIISGSPGTGKVLTSDAYGGASWQSVSGSAWGLNGNAGTVDGTHFIGTTDDVPFNIRVNNTKAGKITSNGQTLFGFQAGNSNSSVYSTAIGYQALFTNTTAADNTAIGYKALYENITGFQNVAVGKISLTSNTYGFGNTAVGTNSMEKNTTGSFNAAIGYNALNSNTVGLNNVALGTAALAFNTASNNNIAIGVNALQSLSFDNGGVEYDGNNIAIGYNALYSNNPIGAGSAANNIGIGYNAMFQNTIGNFNIALGYFALKNNRVLYRSIAIGYEALYSQYGDNSLNGLSTDNIAIGYQALYTNNPTTTNNGKYNIAIGALALKENTFGYSCTSVGSNALTTNTEGSENTAMGYNSLIKNTIGNNNTVLGSNSLKTNIGGNYNTAVGSYSLNTIVNGSKNTTLGYQVIINGDYSNCMALGANSTVTGTNEIRVGDYNIVSIGGYQGWSTLSDKRFKKDVKENVSGLDFIMKLRPVTYHLDMDAIAKFNNSPDSIRDKESERIKGNMLQTGFIAQEVEAAANALGYDFSGVDKPQNEKSSYSLRYAQFTVPLVKAVQEQQVMIEKLQKENEQLKVDIEAIKAKIGLSETK